MSPSLKKLYLIIFWGIVNSFRLHLQISSSWAIGLDMWQNYHFEILTCSWSAWSDLLYAASCSSRICLVTSIGSWNKLFQMKTTILSTKFGVLVQKTYDFQFSILRYIQSYNLLNIGQWLNQGHLINNNNNKKCFQGIGCKGYKFTTPYELLYWDFLHALLSSAVGFLFVFV